jgi:hypothetical protein
MKLPVPAIVYKTYQFVSDLDYLLRVYRYKPDSKSFVNCLPSAFK